MKRISPSDIVEFSRKTEKSRKTFINKLRSPKDIASDGGGDYWVMATSTASKYFLKEDENILTDKVEDIIIRKEETNAKISKNMYDKNITILNNLKDINISMIKPSAELKLLPKPKDKSVLTIRNIPVLVKPQHIFEFMDGNKKKVGGIWFVAKVNGYGAHELALFSDVLYRYLKKNHTNDTIIDTEYCIAFDVITLEYIKYSQIKSGEIKSGLNKLLNDIKNLLQQPY